MLRFLISRRIHRALGWILVTAIIVLSLIPGAPLPNITHDYDDKIAHSFSYALLMAWFAAAERKILWPKIASLVFLLGCALECCQALIPYRTASLGDIVANSLGILIGAIIAIVLTTGSRSLRRAK
jgi:VanZ family protein